MKLLSNRLAGALSFAHLAGVKNATAAAAAEDPPKDPADKEDDDEHADAAASKAEDEQDRDDGGAKADDPNAGDDEDEDKDKAEGKRAKAADDDDDDDDEEMRGKSAVARARLREQARCAAIMSSRAAGRNVVLAAQLALGTRMTRKEAIAVLENTPAAASPNHERRAERNPKLGSGGHLAADSKAAIAASWDRAMERVGAVRRK
ncbi:hypothetical protein B0G84_5731 [Paraburkholderia sp. BL8N3]|nr:hypothetical protein B0G84_5731 [Paraburkholderia sp. BL8N3]